METQNILTNDISAYDAMTLDEIEECLLLFQEMQTCIMLDFHCPECFTNWSRPQMADEIDINDACINCGFDEVEFYSTSF